MLLSFLKGLQSSKRAETPSLNTLLPCIVGEDEEDSNIQHRKEWSQSQKSPGKATRRCT